MVRRPRRRPVTYVSLLLIAAFVLTQTAAVPTQAPAPDAYTIQPFGPPGSTPSEAADISEHGSPIVGHVRSSSGAPQAAVWWYDGYRGLGTFSGAPNTAQSFALGVFYNLVVGRAETASGEFHAFRADLSEGGGLVDLGTLGGSSSAALATEYASTVGRAQVTGNTRWQAVIWTNGVISPVPVSTSGDSSANDIRNDQVVGYSCTSGNTLCRAFWLREATVTTLPTLGGNTVANAINGQEQIVGFSTLGSGEARAFLFDQGAFVNLQTLGGANSEALDINEGGHIVGVSNTATGEQHAFVYRNGAMTDLNALIPDGSGWLLQRATAISDGGQIVGVGTFKGVKRGFILTPPFDLEVSAGGVRSQSTSNLPMGVEAGESGKNIRFVNSVVGTPDPLVIYGARLTATLTGPAEYISATSYDSSPAPECRFTARTITCNLPPIDTIMNLSAEYRFTIRTTGPGAITHRATVTAGTSDVNPANDTIQESNYAVALANLELTPSTVAGGKASSARITLTGLPPGGDAVVRLSSGPPDLAPVPTTLIVPYHNNSATRSFNIIPQAVSQPTAVEIRASYGGVTLTRTLTVVPPALTQLYLTPTTVIGGCGTSAGKVVLSGSAPSSGLVVALNNTNSAASAPSSVTIPAGASSRTFTVTTQAVTTNVTGTLTATHGGVAKALALTVRPIRVKTLTLSPSPATGGTTATATVALECAAPAGGIVLALSSSNPSVAAPSVSSITIPAGATTRSFTVRTSPVTASTPVTIYGSAYGVRRGQSLIVNP